MNSEDIIENITKYVYKQFEHEESGHDKWHIDRVRKLAVSIAEKENANVFIVELAAILHDLIDEKVKETIRLDILEVEKILKMQRVHKDDRDKVLKIIDSISFRKNISQNELSIEGKIVQDADRLDAIGAIGIARTFSFAGSRGHIIYDPEKKNKHHAIQHFYDKLLKLKELMNTETAKHIAEERHLFLEHYLQQFYSEWGTTEK
ncbi:HD domain-containing protein [Metabacillus halosaccharovorans]|uniref:HD domain-containing protein n=1 Tax=Metabacillus halosaccharovorans TaxID=930124 RepID=UPI00203D4838|nr:HD domain-containing protein [Metabacillus halosaccharovorans]MCM3440706.1 HD domain-containing protein [Metabacillus halosaccharovorans]